MTEDKRIRIMLADAHLVYLTGLATLLDAAPDLWVVARTGTAADAVTAGRRFTPDVAVLDPGRSGTDVIDRLRAASPHTGVLVLTANDHDTDVFRAVRAGARGYLLKDAGADDVARAVRAVAGGAAIFGPDMAHRLTGWFAAVATVSRPIDPFPELTHRERQVAELVAAGLSNQVISVRLGISPKTVRNMVSVVLMKLRVADRPEAIIRAREAGLGVPAPGAVHMGA